MMFDLRRLAWGALALLVLIAPTQAQTPAPTPRTLAVTVGQEITVDRVKTSDYKPGTPPKVGTQRTAAEGEFTTIYYKAPDTRTTDVDELTYTVANAARTVKLDISPPAPGFSTDAYDKAAKAIFLLFVLAVVLESALALLFNWRPFVETFNSRAVRPMVAFAVALIFVFKFDLDLITSLVNESTSLAYPVSKAGLILTAMVIAGGSAGVNHLLVSLGFRQVRTPETVTPKPERNEAWISVRLNRVKAVGQVDVCVESKPADAGAADPAAAPTVVGSIRGTTNTSWRYFLSDPGRFPGYGGWTVTPGHTITVTLRGTDKDGQPLPPSKTWGPYVIGKRAVIDIELTL
jgi:hypothetical protein